MSTPTSAHDRRSRTAISRRQVIVGAGAVLAAGVLVKTSARASTVPDTVQLLGLAPYGGAQVGTLCHNIHAVGGGYQGWIPVAGNGGAQFFDCIAAPEASIAGLPDGSTQVFSQLDTDNTTWENTRASNGNWSGWTLLNGDVQAVAAAGFGAVS